MTGTPTGIFCVSVDNLDADPLAAQPLHRGRDVADIVRQYEIASNWTCNAPRTAIGLPDRAEVTARLPQKISRGELVRLLRSFNVSSADGGQLASVAADPYQVRSQWDVLVRNQCYSTRPRDAAPTTVTRPVAVRGGIWSVPVSCSFVGGSRRSVRAQLNRCHRRLQATAEQQGFFHVNIDLKDDRDSWNEECEALSSLFQAATSFHREGTMRFAALGELPQLLSHRRNAVPMRSILRAA